MFFFVSFITIISTRSAWFGAGVCGAFVLLFLCCLIRVPKYKTDSVFALVMLLLLSAEIGASLILHIKGHNFKGNMTFLSLLGGLGEVALTVIVSQLLRKRRCNCPVEAVCSGIDLSHYQMENSNNNLRSDRASYAPIWEYTYEGDSFNEMEKVRSNICRVQKGDKRTIYIDPNDPADFIGVNSKNSIKLVVMISLVTAAMLCFFYSDILF